MGEPAFFLVDSGAGTVHALPVDELEGGPAREPIYRSPHRPPMSKGAERYVNNLLAGASGDVVTEALKLIESGDGYLPVWSTLVSGSDGTIFLQRAFCVPVPELRVAGTSWDVVTPEDEWLGALAHPSTSFRILTGTRDRIVVRDADSLGVERIEVYALQAVGP